MNHRHPSLVRLLRGAPACFALATTLLSGLAAADAPSSAPSSSSISGLLAAGVDLHAQLLELQAQQTPTLQIYIGAMVPEVLMREVTLTIDQLPPLQYQFSELEAAALQQSALQRLQLPGLAAGPHHLRARLVAREPGSSSRVPAVDARLDQSFTMNASGTVLALQLDKPGRLSGAALSLREVADPAALADMGVRHAALLSAGGRALAAASELRVLQQQYPQAAMPVRTAELITRARTAAGIERGADDAVDTEAAADAAMIGRYQSATAAMNAGSGSAALEQLGQGPAQGTLSLALRDQANLALGYQRLREHRGADAIAALQRVRSPGPCDEAALLALGWAYLLPAGPASESAAKLQPVAFEAPRLRPGDADAIAETRRLTPFRYQQAEAKDERALDIRRALVPWAELIGRDPLDPAVQEGMLAVPYALDHFGAHTQAVDFYQRALAQLSAAHDMLNAAQAQLRSGDLLQRLNQRDARDDSGWPRLLVTMRDDGEVVALRQYNTDASFAAALQHYRQLQALQSALTTDQQVLQASSDARAAPLLQQASSVQQQLQPLLAAQAGAVTAAAQQVLTRLGEQTDRYRVEAHFALARANDHLPNEPSFGGATR